MKKIQLTGEKLLKTAINQILARPDTWDQSRWHSPCGSKHCIAGWCQILAGKKINDGNASRDARFALGISLFEADWLFSSRRTLAEIYNFTKNFNRAGYDCAGYNRAGYDCDGYDCDGYNRAGYNRAGYDRAGYDRAGYDCDGYNRAGYNRAGYNCAGYNCDGYDRAGYDRVGYNRDGIKLTPFEI